MEHSGVQHVEAQGGNQPGTPPAGLGPQVTVTALDPINGYVIVDGVAHAITVMPDGSLKLGAAVGPQKDVPPVPPLPQDEPA